MIRMAIQKKAHKEDAVSPVIGVMLMLVVTIVIAAVVAAFSSGLTTSETTGPSTVLSVTMSAAAVPSTNDDYYVHIKHLGGDSLKMSELKIDTTYTVPATMNGVAVNSANVGKVIDHTIDGSLERTEANYIDTSLVGYPFVHQTTTVKSKLLPIAALTSSQSNDGLTMDTYTLKSGSEVAFSKLDFLGFDSDDKLAYGFNEGSIVHVVITHIPSNTVLFNKDVSATW